jgi:hypothetical protein
MWVTPPTSLPPGGSYKVTVINPSTESALEIRALEEETNGGGTTVSNIVFDTWTVDAAVASGSGIKDVGGIGHLLHSWNGVNRLGLDIYNKTVIGAAGAARVTVIVRKN